MIKYIDENKLDDYKSILIYLVNFLKFIWL